VLVQVGKEFGISARLQEMMCKVGQGYVFEEGEQLFSEMMGITVSARQIQRVSEYYGKMIGDQEDHQIQQEKKMATIAHRKEPVYVMMDGAMIFTREEGWKEMKTGRIFAAKDVVGIQPKRNVITGSLYVCHLGDHKRFTKKMEAYCDEYDHKICVADGAPWIWNWLENAYSQTVQILDFYHAAEKLGSCAHYHFPEEQPRKAWLEQQKQKLLNNEVEQVIATVEQLPSLRNKEAKKTKEDLIRYYQSNCNRMQYKTYLEQGYLIGSGPIESAHRHVVQHRLKLSGQRWSKPGAQSIVNLRAYQKSDRWCEIIDCIKKAA
jgi:hypothetical protein